MRSFIRHALVLGTSALLLTGVACARKEKSEYVTGVSTQVSVPRDLKSIQLQVSVGGVRTFCQSYAVYDGKVLLPRSLGTFAQNPSPANLATPITYSILGIAEEIAGSSNQVFATCEGSVGTSNVRVLRRSTQPYVENEILLLPMPLKYSCFDVKCGDNETCKGGVCVSDVTDPSTLARYTPELENGTGGECFSVGLCMGAAVPAIMTDAATCTFVVPESKDAPVLADPKSNPLRGPCTTAAECNGGVTPPDPAAGRACNNGACDFLPANAPPWIGANVEISYDGAHTKEILDLEPTEGFSIPDPAKPQQFKLSPGLCAMLKGVDSKGVATQHRITGVRTSGTCAAKGINQPLCLADQLKAMGADPATEKAEATVGQCNVGALIPPRAALMIVVDNSKGHGEFFNEKQIDSVSIPLEDPTLAQTDIGLLFAGGANTCGGAPAVALTPKQASPQLSAEFRGALSAGKPAADAADLPPSFESALTQAYVAIRNQPGDYARRGVLVVGNRQFDADQCTPGDGVRPTILAAEALADGAKPVRTYALQVVGDAAAQPQQGERDGLRVAGSGAEYASGVTNEAKLAAVEAFQAVVSDLATCTYDWDPAKLDDGTQLYYGNGLLGKSSDPIVRDVACTAGKLPDKNVKGGWNYANAERTRIAICDKSCLDYRKVLLDQAKFAAAYGQSAISGPIYARSSGCEKKVP